MGIVGARRSGGKRKSSGYERNVRSIPTLTCSQFQRRDIYNTATKLDCQVSLENNLQDETDCSSIPFEIQGHFFHWKSTTAGQSIKWKSISRQSMYRSWSRKHHSIKWPSNVN